MIIWMKQAIGILTILITILGYLPYIRDTLRGKTKPHAYSWFVWGLITSIIFALQISAKAGPGAYGMLSGGVIALFIFAISLKSGKQNITKSDSIFFVLALISIIVWIFAKQPIIAVVLLWIIDVFGLIPTVRKSWQKPHSETVFLYQTGIVKYLLSIVAISRYNFTTLLFPITWALINTSMTTILLYRRKQTNN